MVLDTFHWNAHEKKNALGRAHDVSCPYCGLVQQAAQGADGQRHDDHWGLRTHAIDLHHVGVVGRAEWRQLGRQQLDGFLVLGGCLHNKLLDGHGHALELALEHDAEGPTADLPADGDVCRIDLQRRLPVAGAGLACRREGMRL